jgi:hypothetical protein
MSTEQQLETTASKEIKPVPDGEVARPSETAATQPEGGFIWGQSPGWGSPGGPFTWAPVKPTSDGE